jgi:general secretion pathway protein D
MKRVLVCFVALMLLSWTAVAQEKGTSKQDESQAPATRRSGSPEAQSRDTYKLDYTVTELEDGRKLNTRTYTLMCENETDPHVGAGGRWGAHLRVGSRVPVATGSFMPGGGENKASALVNTQFQYIDVGMNIDAGMNITDDGGLTLASTVEMSSVAEPNTAGGSMTNPVIRQLRASTNSVITPGKPIVLSTADDVGSKRRFEVQVVATKVSGK